MRTVIYPGSFDPITFGHLDIIRRAAKLFDHVYVAVMTNTQKSALFTLDERLQMLKASTAGLPNVTCETFAGLAVEYAKSRGATAMVRGLRAVSDFEVELKMAHANRHLDPGIEMVYLMTNSEHAFLSSTIVKEVASMGGYVGDWVPEPVAAMLKAKFSRKGPNEFEPDELGDTPRSIGPVD